MADNAGAKRFLRILASGALFVLFFCVLHITPSIARASEDADASSHDKVGVHFSQCFDHSVVRHHNNEDDAIRQTALPATTPASVADAMPVFRYEKRGRGSFSIIGFLPERLIFIRDNNIRI